MKTTRTQILAATTVIGGICFSPASALAQIVGDDVLTALNKQYSYQGFTVSGGEVSTSGDNVTISGATISGAEGDFALPDLVMEGVESDGNGGYTIATATASGIEFEEDGAKFSLGNIVVNGYVIASPDETDPILRSGIAKSATMGPIVFSNEGQVGFTAAGINMDIGDYNPGQPWTSSLVMSDFTVDTTVLDDPQAQQTMAALGYQTLTGDVTANGRWDPATGLMTAEDFVISVDNAASIGLDFALGGYNMELIEAMQQINATAENEQAAGMAMLGLMQQLEIGGAAITLTDASLTNKLLEFAGQQQGTNAEGMKAFAKGMLPLGLAQLQSPEFAAKATAEIGSFLDNPGTLVIEAQPAQPIPVMQLAAPMMSGNPALLIEALALDIRAE
ncbi:MAG: hypothetical protein AAFR71_06620 [Pseudomonadota bacterium]